MWCINLCMKHNFYITKLAYFYSSFSKPNKEVLLPNHYQVVLLCLNLTKQFLFTYSKLYQIEN